LKNRYPVNFQRMQERSAAWEHLNLLKASDVFSSKSIRLTLFWRRRKLHYQNAIFYCRCLCKSQEASMFRFFLTRHMISS